MAYNGGLSFNFGKTCEYMGMLKTVEDATRGTRLRYEDTSGEVPNYEKEVVAGP